VRSLGLIVISFSIFAGPAIAAEQTPALLFAPGAMAGELRFDTGVLRGVLREGGASVGLNPIEHTAGSVALAKWPGLLNYYRVFTTKHRHGDTMRDVRSEAEVIAPDTLRVRWAPCEERPFALTATYRWSAPDTLDVETVVEAKTALPDFEVFLSSYAVDRFPAAAVYVKLEDGKSGFVAADPRFGQWQMFPRDAAAVKLIQDGRWAIPPNPVDWVIRPEFAAPLSYRRDPASKLAIIIMTRPQDCFALSAPQSNDPHYSLYQSLFGRTLAAGDTARACTRMIVAPLEEAAIVTRYEEFRKAFVENR